MGKERAKIAEKTNDTERVKGLEKTNLRERANDSEKPTNVERTLKSLWGGIITILPQY